MKAIAVFRGKAGSIHLTELLAHRVEGLESCSEMVRLLTQERNAIHEGFCRLG